MTTGLLTRLGVILAVLVAVWLGLNRYGAHRESVGYKRAEAESTAVANAASTAARIKADKQTEKVEKELKDAKERANILAADAGRAHAESERLRVSLKASRDKLSAASSDAVRQYAATLGDVFAECGAEAERLAREAGGHASDSLMYQRSWPKE